MKFTDMFFTSYYRKDKQEGVLYVKEIFISIFYINGTVN